MSGSGAAGAVAVQLRTLAGECLDLQVPPPSTALELRRRAAEELLRRPEADCVGLVDGTTVLRDSDQVGTVAGSRATLTLTVVVNVQVLYDGLTRGKASERLAAVKRLRKNLPPNPEATVAALACCLDDQDGSVRREAVQALLDASGRGDESVIGAVLQRLRSPDSGVRVNAALALPRVAKENDARIVEALSPLVNDPDTEVRRIALLALNLWVGAATAHDWAEKGLAIFVDARDAEAFAVSRIPGAFGVAVPWPPGLNLINELGIEAVVHAALEDPRKSVVVYSDTGTETSRCAFVARALHKCPALLPSRVYRLAGGLNAWKERGLPVEGDRRAMFLGMARDRGGGLVGAFS